LKSDAVDRGEEFFFSSIFAQRDKVFYQGMWYNRIYEALVKRFYRISEGRKLAGVCTGLGDYFNLDPVLFRIAFIITAIAYGTGFLLYFVMWIIVPVKK
jgi:phage shock protein PspC (stress-responsive transcriptional regulator)